MSSQPPIEIKFFVEGGGENKKAGRDELRLAFDALVGEQKDAARKKRMRWSTVFCGGRSEAAREFANSVRRQDARFVVLLVDSEDEVRSAATSEPSPLERVNHLRTRDGWSQLLAAAKPEHVHLMTRCMEAWIVADGEVLERYYGQGFALSALPKRARLDDEPKQSVYSALERATERSQKGRYGKIKHASDLMRQIRPEVVAERCVSFRQFMDWLRSVIDSV